MYLSVIWGRVRIISQTRSVCLYYENNLEICIVNGFMGYERMKIKKRVHEPVLLLIGCHVTLRTTVIIHE